MPEIKEKTRIVLVNITYNLPDGTPVAMEELTAKELKQLRFHLLAKAGKIKNRIFDLTGEELN